MNPVSPENSRILELGCAAGGNIIPHAINYPKAQCVGVDLSEVQIEEAKLHVKNLELKNMTFYQCSVTDIDESFGKFDYIICHGVFSWVPDFVRDKILEVCSKNLAPQGIAYISYNTLPGWNAERTIRDMMLYEASTVQDSKQKVLRARSFLTISGTGLESLDTPYASHIKDAVKRIAILPDHYILHEYLEDENTQFYFKDFVALAQRHGLRYLCDSFLSSLYLGNMPSNVINTLSKVGDTVLTEQYMDFINNRKFRSSLLTHDTIKVSYVLLKEDIKKVYLYMPLRCSVPVAERNLHDTQPLVFFSLKSSDIGFSANTYHMKAIACVFEEKALGYIDFNTLIACAAEKLGTSDPSEIEKIETDFTENAMLLLLKGALQVTMQPPPQIDYSDKPRLDRLVAYQLSNSKCNWVTNRYHTNVAVNKEQAIILRYADGSRTCQEIAKCLKPHLDNGDLFIQVRINQTFEEVLISKINNVLDMARSSYLLISE
jgi:methyltransferase-like protein/trans-aconitate methyltransferase